jgi:hypothetical protein
MTRDAGALRAPSRSSEPDRLALAHIGSRRVGQWRLPAPDLRKCRRRDRRSGLRKKFTPGMPEFRI